MKKRIFCLGVLCLFLSHQAVGQATSEESLQEQIDQTPENGILELENKVYIGDIVLHKPMTIRGQEGTIIRGTGKGNVIEIQSPHTHLEQFQVEHGSKNLNSKEEYAAIKVNSDYNVIQHIAIRDVYHGIFLKNVHDNRIQEVTIQGGGKNEIASQGNGIQLVHGHHNQLVNNTIQEVRDGMYFYYSDNNEVVGNHIQKTRYGLHYMYANHNRFHQNVFSHNNGGAAIMMAQGITLTDNSFSFHNAPQSFGILLQSVQDSTIERNHFYQNGRGLYVDEAQKGKIVHNFFSNNRIGIEIWSSASGQVFAENQFFHNTIPVIRLGNGETNQWSLEGKGNDWGEQFPQWDTDQNGIGDTPLSYRSSLPKLVEQNELVMMFLDTPAMMIYEKINEVLHQQDVMFTDEFPLLHQREGESMLPWGTLVLFGILAFYLKGRRRRI